MNRLAKSIRQILRQPALSVGEGIFLLCMIAVFWVAVVLIESNRTASAQPLAEEEMLRDFGLLPETPLDLTPVRLEYSGAPVPIVIGAGTERRLIFEQPFRIGLEPAVAGYFDLEIYDRHLLLRALRPVSTRVRVQLASGLVIPLDIRAVAGAGPAGPVEIAVVQASPSQPVEEPPVVPASALPQPMPAPGYVELVRHAAQQLYAPERLRTVRRGMTGIPVSNGNHRLVRGVHVEARPVAAWEEGGLVVTAVRIDNLEKRTIRLDPRDVVGRWRAAAFQYARLRSGETTALYLVSDKPFEEALGIFAPIAREPVASASPDTPGINPEDRN